MFTGAIVWQFNMCGSPPEVSPSTHRANRGGVTQCKKELFLQLVTVMFCCFSWVSITFLFLERVHGLEFAEGLDRGDVFLLGASSHTRLALLRLLPFNQRLLLRGLHAPRHHG